MRSNLRMASAIFAAGVALAACGHIAIRDEAGRNVGLEVYPPIPFIMVSRTNAKDKPMEVSVVYLPDTSRPRYVHLQPGLIGSSKLSVSVTNGMVSTLGAESSSGVTELLTAYGGLATSLANAAKTRDDIEAQQRLRQQASDLPAYARTVANIVAGLNTLQSNQGGALTPAKMDFFFGQADAQGVRSGGVRGRLGDIVRELRAADAGAQLPTIRRRLVAIAAEWDANALPVPAGASEQSFAYRLSQLRADLDRVINVSAPPEAPPADEFTLFEIVTSGQDDARVTTLREVRREDLRAAAASISASGNR